MAEVLQSGRYESPWAIELRCGLCRCLAIYVGRDVRLRRGVGTQIDNTYVVCPECSDFLFARTWSCNRCGNTKLLGDGHACPCSNTKGAPC